MASPTRRKPLRSPFVVTVSALAVPAAAAVAVAVGGCSGALVTSNPPPPDGGVDQCPTTAPANGSSCNLAAGVFCNYGECNTLRCSDTQTWQTAAGSCNPPPPQQCPAKAPQVGTTCGSVPAAGCTFPADGNLCIGSASNFACDGDTQTWRSSSKPTCPALPAAVGSPCGGLCPTTFDASCTYRASGPASECEIDRICDNGKWMDSSPTCNPPPPLRDAGTD
ncbi:MAG: hypothetical protein HOO96_09495 [Polyangiaceae bacterium]|nr:hypothetical protein [Polyangiaceae bacterium]